MNKKTIQIILFVFNSSLNKSRMLWHGELFFNEIFSIFVLIIQQSPVGTPILSNTQHMHGTQPEVAPIIPITHGTTPGPVGKHAIIAAVRVAVHVNPSNHLQSSLLSSTPKIISACCSVSPAS